MIRTKAKFNPNFVYETQEVIVSAISKDFNNVDLSIAGQDLLMFEQEDPLGMAFYIFALLETEYVSQEFTSRPEDWKYWVESRLDIEIPTPYIDTELSALGLIIYALSRKEVLPENIDKFLNLAEEHFTETSGIYRNFLALVLVGLGVSRLENNESIFEKIKKYTERQIKNNQKNIYNDPKNLVVTYLWSKEVKDKQLTKSVRTEVFRRFENDDYLDRDIVYLAYVLFEEIKTFSRKERREIKEFIEESLRFIRDYTLENKSSSSFAVSNEIGRDIAFENESVWDMYGYPHKPELSRILLSLGLLIERKYITSPQLLDGSEQLLQKFAGIMTYGVSFLIIGLLAFWGWGSIEFINNYGTDLKSKEFLDFGTGLFKLIISIILLLIVLFFTAMSVLNTYYIIKSIDGKHKESIKKSLNLVLTKGYGGTTVLIAIVIEMIT